MCAKNVSLTVALVCAFVVGAFTSDAKAFSLKAPRWAKDAWNGTIRDTASKLGDNLSNLCTLEFINKTDRTLLMSVGSKESLVAPGGSIRNKVGTFESRTLMAKDPQTKAIVYTASSGKARPGKTTSKTIVVDKKTKKIVTG